MRISISTSIFSLLLYLSFSSFVNAAGTFAVIANSPGNGDVRIPLEVQPTATVNKDIFEISIYGFRLINTDTGWGVHTDYSYDAATRTITLTPSSPLDEFTNYTASVQGVTSLDGETIDPAYTWTFRSQDRTAPTVSSTHESGLYITKLNVELNCTDVNGSGCAAIHYTLDGTEPTINSPVYSSAIFLDEGIHTLKYFSIDNEDNKSEIQSRQYTVDLTPPEVTQPLSPENNATDINVKSIISLGLSEEVRPETVNTSTIVVDNGTVGNVNYDALTNTVTYTPKERLTCNTLYTVSVKKAVTDLAGNTMSNDFNWTFSTSIDCVDPVASVSTAGGVLRQSDLTIYLSCTDNQSGCNQIVYTIDGTPPSFEPLNGNIVDGTNTESILLSEGNTKLRYFAEDNAGNLSAEKEQTYSLSTQGFLYVGSDNGIARGVGPEADDFVFNWKQNGAVGLYYDETIGRLYLGAAEGLFYSDDLGRHWTFRNFDHPYSTALRAAVLAIYAEGSKVYTVTETDLFISHDGLATSDYADGIGRYVRDIVANGRYVYAATSKGLAISDTKGQTFITKGLESGLNNVNLTSLAVDGQRIFVTTENGLSISHDGGESFVNRTVDNGLASNSYLRDVFVDGNNVYVATWSGLSISTDGGQTFVTMTETDGLLSTDIMSTYANGSTVYAGTTKGLAISHDGGQSFTTLTVNDGLPSNYVRNILEVGNKIFVSTPEGLAVSDDGGISFRGLGLAGTYPRNIIAQGNLIYASSTSGLLSSSDGGASFELRNAQTGLANGYITDMHLTPDNKLFVSTTEGLSYSTDNGMTFNTYTSELGLPSNNINSTYVNEENTIFGTSSWGLVLKKNKGSNKFSRRTTKHGLIDNSSRYVDGANNVLYVGSYYGLSISYDGGRTFTTRTTADGLARDRIGRIYATDTATYIDAGGLYVSYDNGQTFTLKNNTVPLLSLSGYGQYLYTGGYDLNISTDGGETFTTRDHTNGIGDYITSIWSGSYTP